MEVEMKMDCETKTTISTDELSPFYCLDDIVGLRKILCTRWFDLIFLAKVS